MTDAAKIRDGGEAQGDPSQADRAQGKEGERCGPGSTGQPERESRASIRGSGGGETGRASSRRRNRAEPASGSRFSDDGPAGEDEPEALGRVREKAVSAVREKAGSLADEIEHIADVIAKGTRPLLGDRTGRVAEVTDRGIDGLRSAARYVREESLRTMASDVAALARRRPGLFLGGLFTAGLLAGRFLHASRPVGEEVDDDEVRDDEAGDAGSFAADEAAMSSFGNGDDEEGDGR